jgi:hypothetical protein
MICPLRGHVKYVHNSILGHEEDAIYVNVFDVILMMFLESEEEVHPLFSLVSQKLLSFLKGKFRDRVKKLSNKTLCMNVTLP